MKTDDELEIVDRDDPQSETESAEPTVSDSFDPDDDLIDAELGERDDLLLDEASLEDEADLDSQFDETIEDVREMMLLQELGIDLDDIEDLASEIAFDPSLTDDDTMDDEAAA